MIIYFSATGNSRHVAETIASRTSDTAMSMQEEEACTLNIAKGEPLGIVSPTYAWGIPDFVEKFLKELSLSADSKTYIYFVATYGVTPGNSAHFAEKALRAGTGRQFDACFGVKMPDTWTPIFNLSNPEKVSRIIGRVNPQITEIIEKINSRKSGNFMRHRVPGFTAVFYRPIYGLIRQTVFLRAEQTCIGCGLCASNCPDKAIEMRDGRPVWVKRTCTMCLGCLHRCPKFAIQYLFLTKRHGQYRFPTK
ncbi:MAG: EFR1 family ferrodoxin [Eubacterium sp.]|jgi:ferredoxin